MLEFGRDLEIVGDAGGVEEAFEVVRGVDADVLIIDLDSSQLDVAEVLRTFSQINAKLAVYILTGNLNFAVARRAISAGALGYSSKAISPAELIAGVRLVGAGRPSIGDDLALHLLAELCPKNSKCRSQGVLSPREYEIYLRLVKGFTYSSIAEDLGLSVKTIATHKSNILLKLRVDSMSSLIQHAIGNAVFQ